MFGGRLGTGEILIIVALLILIFGWKRLPDAARSLGRSMRIFKSEVSEMKQDGKFVQEIRLTSITYSAKIDPEVFQHLQGQ